MAVAETARRRIAILGSTGSVGRQALEVVEASPERFELTALTANTNLKELTAQVERHRPAAYACNAPDTPARIGGAQRSEALEIATGGAADTVLFANSGYDMLPVLLGAVQSGKAVALANKEPLVMAGGIIMDAVRKHGAELLPVDSEPSAVHQCLRGEAAPPARIVVTASGGALRGRSPAELSDVTPEEVLRHPTWRMGRKITVDSATMVNKAFEMAEMHWLFSVPLEGIEAVIHPQSAIHSLVVFADGTCKAQISPPDMRYAIQYALLAGERIGSPLLDAEWRLADLSPLTLEPLRDDDYPCFRLALEHIRRGGTWPAAFVGAGFSAVRLFLEGAIRYPEIQDAIAFALERHSPSASPGLEEIAAAAGEARAAALEYKR